ncbi:transposase [Streptomyces sp. NPDC086787]|uniref:transposase n=1 Tax=Streptomyces sp. NPDC086787 TaxID=3365759 RepID=UPI0037F8086E
MVRHRSAPGSQGLTPYAVRRRRSSHPRGAGAGASPVPVSCQRGRAEHDRLGTAPPVGIQIRRPSTTTRTWGNWSEPISQPGAGPQQHQQCKHTFQAVTGLYPCQAISALSGQLAEWAGHRTPDGFQRLLNSSVWDADAVGDDVRGYVAERLGSDGVLIMDDTGSIKKGSTSAGVGRQYEVDPREWTPGFTRRVSAYVT